MEQKHKVFNLIVLDESGSMEAIKSTIIQGFNEVVQTIKGLEKQFPQQEHYISFVTFNGLSTRIHLMAAPVRKLEQIDADHYKPDATTPLFDAMGFAIGKLRRYLEGHTNYNVLVTILTDGEENASKEYNGRAIKSLVEELKQENWTFTYIGANHDVEKFAASISIANTMHFTADQAGMEAMFDKEKTARWAFSKKIMAKMDTSRGFYDSGADKKK